jgi:O-antigen ligase
VALCTRSAGAEAAVFLVVAGACAIVVVRHPEWGALAVVSLAMVVPRETLFGGGIPVGPGSVKLTDALVVLSIGAWVAHRAIDPGARRLPSPSVTALVLGMVAVGVTGVVVAGLNGVPLQQSLNEFRPFMAFLIVFPLVAFVRGLPGLRQALVAVLSACAVGSAWIVLLYVQGEGSEATFTSGAIRITEVAFLPAMLGSVWALVLLPHCRTMAQQVSVSLLGVVCLTGLFFTLQRGAWLAFIGASLLAAALMTPARRARLVVAGVVIAAALVGSVLVFNSFSSAGVGNPLQDGLQRLQSVNSYDVDVSALHREVETKAALEEFRQHPLAGIGLGATLSFFSPLFNPNSGSFGYYSSNTYVHNSYLFMLLKTGLVGLIVLLALLAHTLARGVALSRSKQLTEVRIGALGLATTVTALMAVSVSGPHLTSDPATPYVAAAVAGLDILCRASRAESVTAPEASRASIAERR